MSIDMYFSSPVPDALGEGDGAACDKPVTGGTDGGADCDGGLLNEATLVEFTLEDEAFMRHALALAEKAEALDEVPVGAVAVKDGVIIGEGYNTRETGKCALDHAEIHAIEEACKTLGGWRLPGVTLYVTMEPCCMCAGAVVNARIPRVVYGTPDLRFGAFGSLFDLSAMAVNHRPTVEGGLLLEECRGVLQGYFKRKREKKG